MESKSRDEYREEAILWLHRQREYYKLAELEKEAMSVHWEIKASEAAAKVQFYASLAGLESIEEMEE